MVALATINQTERTAGEIVSQLGHHAQTHRPEEGRVIKELCGAFENSCVPLAQRLQSFPRHVRRQDLARFLARSGRQLPDHTAICPTEPSLIDKSSLFGLQSVRAH